MTKETVKEILNDIAESNSFNHDLSITVILKDHTMRSASCQCMDTFDQKFAIIGNSLRLSINDYYDIYIDIDAIQSISDETFNEDDNEN